MKATVFAALLTLVAMITLVPSIFTSEQASAQMMNPNMMNLMGGMMNFGQNVTGSINLMDSMFNSVASQIKVNLTDAVATAQKQLGGKITCCSSKSWH